MHWLTSPRANSTVGAFARGRFETAQVSLEHIFLEHQGVVLIGTTRRHVTHELRATLWEQPCTQHNRRWSCTVGRFSPWDMRPLPFSIFIPASVCLSVCLFGGFASLAV
jgi:hypothetical protein